MAYLTSIDWPELATLILLGLLPSAVWLWYYLRKDNHPEPKMMVLGVFWYGFLGTFFAFSAEWAFMKTLADTALGCGDCGNKSIGNLDALGTVAVSSFFILGTLAFIEEIAKYLSAKIKIIRSAAFDEPIDAMIYLIVAALGFAAAENIGYVFQAKDAATAVGVTFYRFISATALHTLASAVVGYFLALSIIHKKHPLPYVGAGLLFATLLHTLFNFLIILSEENSAMVTSVVLLMIVMFFFVSELFVHVKRLHFEKLENRI
ncbi:hypothetical protein A3C91_01290 [Candidatus Azambacteria bacterium RIFCSPHIGHO2_02_FULL_52_12]|uniref:Protease PrsW n=1 Tax=Candidatus Azambacteria bacterium RIFCSPLOWO2_01_FULL_46_25 TaxID=1797298 RepID=A0A1F5BVA6_9BACT|nr:MAG: hypothetical protein A3C91_01290 [Candidatus Azambacteria bacterium RIFCSPHIGHO2_02_FULL_52_12]OGD34523.1 MAG: hypothetical protein A2988_03350 [Candidatus Azambacteria bacterium RIFCSPLOWO2_01_FULL_46_25]OGD36397.1 MAG: hypothetical protein A2850_01850 [Candidatus Azambacteria bacterium RIFCSPHIGHO2_01_FULL_51_74]